MERLKGFLEARLGGIVLAIVAVQPALDVLSYFLGEMGSNAASTPPRFVMLAAVAPPGVLLRGAQRFFFFLYAGAGAFLSGPFSPSLPPPPPLPSPLPSSSSSSLSASPLPPPFLFLSLPSSPPSLSFLFSSLFFR